MVARGRGIPPGRQLITWCCFAGRRAAVAVCPPRRGCQPPVPPPPLPPPPPPDAVAAIARSPPLIRVGSLRPWQAVLADGASEPVLVCWLAPPPGAAGRRVLRHPRRSEQITA